MTVEIPRYESNLEPALCLFPHDRYVREWCTRAVRRWCVWINTCMKVGGPQHGQSRVECLPLISVHGPCTFASSLSSLHAERSVAAHKPFEGAECVFSIAHTRLGRYGGRTQPALASLWVALRQELQTFFGYSCPLWWVGVMISADERQPHRQ